jgi:phosphoribosylformimino-5-aminoimidazole carboxamide ribotide isomerase
MTLFRPCIDLHGGQVKQIVGGTLSDDETALETNFVADRSAADFAGMYRDDGLRGGHVIQLGPGNEDAALSALAAYPGGLHLGGGVTPRNAATYLDAGASHVIVTGYLFVQGRFSASRLSELTHAVGARRLVIDLSCRRQPEGWVVATDRWQTRTDLWLNHETLDRLAGHCDEFLVHAADIEGRAGGMDEALVACLGSWGRKPVTYAGGAREMRDFERVDALSHGRVDLTVGTALDIFGGSGIRYTDCVEWNRRHPSHRAGDT